MKNHIKMPYILCRRRLLPNEMSNKCEKYRKIVKIMLKMSYILCRRRLFGNKNNEKTMNKHESLPQAPFCQKNNGKYMTNHGQIRKT